MIFTFGEWKVNKTERLSTEGQESFAYCMLEAVYNFELVTNSFCYFKISIALPYPRRNTLISLSINQ